MTKDKIHKHLSTSKDESSRIGFSLPTKRFAFTLAEVLITLGIIGVVAAITIPGLILNYKAHQLHSQFLKSYSTIYQVVKRMQDDEVSFDADSYSIGSFPKMFGQYLQGATNCAGKKKKPCYYVLTDQYKTLSGKNTVSMNGYLNDGQWLLQDGSILMIENGGADWGGHIFVTVDLNGYGAKPDRFGLDIFSFQLIDGELKAMGETGTYFCSDEQQRESRCNFEEAGDNLNGICCAYYAKSNSEYFKKALKSVK